MVDVAQLVEPRIVIPAVAGSSPVVHPTFENGCESRSALLEKVLGPLAQLVEQLTLNQLVVGSIPTRPTNLTSENNQLRRSPIFCTAACSNRVPSPSFRALTSPYIATVAVRAVSMWSCV